MVTYFLIWFVDRKRQQRLHWTMRSVGRPWPNVEWESVGGSEEGVVGVGNDVNGCLHCCFRPGS